MMITGADMTAQAAALAAAEAAQAAAQAAAQDRALELSLRHERVHSYRLTSCPRCGHSVVSRVEDWHPEGPGCDTLIARFLCGTCGHEGTLRQEAR